MKFAFLMGKAPADFAAMASKMYPVVVSTPLVRPLGLTANQFITALAVFEMVAALGFFFSHKAASIMVVAVMAGAEYIACTQGSNPAMPPSPACVGEAACAGSRIFHGILVVMAIMSYMSDKPVCAAWSGVCKKWGCGASSKKAGETAQTPSRPRRAASMKKKDN